VRLLKTIYLTCQRILDGLVLIGARLGFISRYQPLYGCPSIRADRPSHDRWQVIAPHLPTGRFSALDIGSQFGYFTLLAASSGGVCLGIERVWQYRAVADALARKSKLANAGFFHLELNADSVNGLPNADVVFCLSVFHHWVLDWEFSGADAIFSGLCHKTQRLVFETGQYDEVDQAFAKEMSFMGDDCHKWIADYLKSKGFDKIIHLGEFATHLGPHRRHLFLAEKKQ
jgi:hypothetical protein